MNTQFLSPDLIRDKFSKAMSKMYQHEVPQYEMLLDLVKETNKNYIEKKNQEFKNSYTAELNRLNVERHGAIRLGTHLELSIIKDLFEVMGMYPVSYYDLSAAGVPVHATAFRPIRDESLQINPFRIFTSLLRSELIEDESLREKAETILNKRKIFTDRIIELISINRSHGGLNNEEADEFIQEALKTFQWHHEAQISFETYNAFLQQHRLIADVVSFKGPHINHLTPRTLDIDEVQRKMSEWQMIGKEVIEGPPPRKVPILLRQTSFKALSEEIIFSDEKEGKHTARFGEIEQRGLALTPTGRQLYDKLLLEANNSGQFIDNHDRQKHYQTIFEAFPDDIYQIRNQGLGYFKYSLIEGKKIPTEKKSYRDLDWLISHQIVTFTPIIYEDFLPVSAAGIFQSNLGNDAGSVGKGNPNKEEFEHSLGCQTIDEFALYEAIEQDSIMRLFRQ